jgi:amino acid adenylation domain-containing protein
VAVSWNDTGREYDLQRGPHEFIEQQVSRTPDAPALIMGAERMTYGQLNAQANRLAHYLRAQGIGPNCLVGVYLERSIAMVVALLGILKSGGAYFPLDPKFPRDRLALMLEDAEAPLLLTQLAKQASLPATKSKVVALDDESAFQNFPASNPDPANQPGDLAYVIYTSGSTGKPKGVMIPRNALVNFLHGMVEAPGLKNTDVVLAITTISFDISILELLLPLMTGGQMVLATREEAADAEALQRLLEQHRVTVMQATPTAWRMLVESGWKGKSDLRILCGGEALAPDLARQLLPRCRELWNMYGPTETTIWSSAHKITSGHEVFVGPPMANTQFYVVDEKQQPVALGTSGELLIGGFGVALGYLKRPELTVAKFIADTLGDLAGGRLYRTGDEVRMKADGRLEFMGRMDDQVKLRGFRIELGEIESNLAKIAGIRRAVAMVREDRSGDQRLVAYYAGAEELAAKDLTSEKLAQALKAMLPEYMIPSAFVRVEEFPLTPNGKLDKKALPAPQRKRPLLAQEYIAPQSALEKQLAEVWCELLQLDQVGLDDSFFDLGGNSLAVVRMANLYRQRFAREIPPVKVFQYPTISQLCHFLEDRKPGAPNFSNFAGPATARRNGNKGGNSPLDSIAIIGMVGRFPGADNIETLWQNLCHSVESISFFKPEELGPGIEAYLRNDPDYIRARGILQGAELFDAAFFGISPLEAKVMDPQQRVFLELAHHALENAGYDPSRYTGMIGVYAGAGDNHYYTTNLLSHPEVIASAGKLTVEYGNEKDYIALRTAYALDLRGPAISLNTACSTALVTIDSAVHALLNRECDMALAGGIDISVPQKSGFLYQEGGTFAKDGHCCPFDAEATGTMFCDGAGIVVLKRLQEALADGDTIYSVIRGSAKNNNGARPASFLAPSVEGQAEVIALAQERAGVSVETIGYIEAHGTGTPVGDPIEIEALCKVFEAKTRKKHFCYVGSIKGNIGHPTNAAGVVGLIKAALVLQREQIPPTLHFKTLNPKIDLADSPFKIADRLVAFPKGDEPRRAAVSSFGFGGTNVHTILEEAPPQTQGTPSRPVQLLLTSARTAPALDACNKSLAEYFASAGEADFADAAYTLQLGRKQMAHRSFVIAANAAEASKFLQEPHPLRGAKKRCERRDPPVVFMFGGQGSQYVNMGKNLYQGEPLFRAVVDDCCDFLKPHLGRDLRDLLFPQPGNEATAQQSLQDTFFTQPSIFVIEYALARFWQSLGIQPAMMVGHSIGEFVAATLAGVWDLQDALRIIALRGQLMQNLRRGSMLSVGAGVESIQKMLTAFKSLQIASNNAPSLCVVAGPDADVAAFKERLEAQNIFCRPLHTSHAFHSSMMEPMLEPLRAEVAKVQLRAPALPFVSTVTGKPITEKETTDPGYWSRHARSTVEFAKAVEWLIAQRYDLFLECGPRATLCSMARKQFTAGQPSTAVPSLADTHVDNAEWVTILFALGTLWQNGVSVDWDAFYAHEMRRRIPLPAYPFERQRYWVDPASETTNAAATVQRQPVSQPLTAEVNESAAQANESQAVVGGSRKDLLTARLVEILMPLSGRERSDISTTATFLEQGLDSLSLTQVAFAIRQEFGYKVSFSRLMNELPNIEMLAAHLDRTLAADVLAKTQPPQIHASQTSINSNSLAAERRPASSPLEDVVAEQARAISRLVALLEKAGAHSASLVSSSSTGPLPPTRMLPAPEKPQQQAALRTVESTLPQRGIYFSSRLSDHLSACYNESMTLYIQGTVSAPKLTRAIERLVQRHDALRGSFDESGMVMRIAPLVVHVPVTDLSTISDPATQEHLLEQLIAEETALPFRLPEGPLFRSQIVLLAADSAAVVFTGHHTICDGWSLDVLIHDLCAFYSEEISDSPVALQTVRSYVDYVRSVTERAKSAEFTEARAYWHEKFSAGFNALVLPTNRPRPGRHEYAASRLDRMLPVSLVHDLRKLAAKQGCSFFAVILGAVSLLLAGIARQRRFVLALPIAEQPAVGQPGLVGHCVNMVPFAVEVIPGESASLFLARVQHEVAAAQDHVAFPLVNLLEELRPVRSVHGVVSISAGLTHVKKWNLKDLPQSGFTVDYAVNPKSFESLEWYLNAVEVEDGLELKCQFDKKLFEDRTVAGWLAALEQILSELVADSSQDAAKVARLTDSRAPAAEALYLVADGRATKTVHGASGYTPPQTEAEKTLVKIWQEALSLDEVGIHDDFFELGGQSLSAVTVVTKIEQAFGTRLPLASLIEAPTIRQLAELVSGNRSSRSWSALVALDKSGTKPPIFLFHSHGGNILEYYPLARRLSKDSKSKGKDEDKDRPVYALQSRGLDGSIIEEPRVEEMASYYLKEIRSVQPHGPYYLGGFCLGGMLALEAAQQLQREGEPVDLVFMINAPTANYLHYPPETNFIKRLFYQWHSRLALELSYLTNRSQEHRTTYLWARGKRVREVCQVRAEMFWDKLVNRGNRPAPQHSLAYHLEHLAMAYDRAWEAYEPKPYEGRVLQIRAGRQPLGIRPDPTLGWSELLTGEFTIETIPGFRQNLLDEPTVGSLASSIQNTLDKCEKLNALYGRETEDSYQVSVRLTEPGVAKDSTRKNSSKVGV